MKKALVSVLLTSALVLSAVPAFAAESQSAEAQSTVAQSTDAQSTGAQSTVAQSTEAQSTEAQSTEAQSAAAQSTETQSEEAKDKAPEASYMEDFTVETIDGSTFTLSEALKDHDLVLINLWATWCPPCEFEFPFLQEAWEQDTDKVAVIALSVEPQDTLEDLKAYAQERDLTFPMGLVGDTGLESYASQGTPTSVLVGSDRKILASEVGAQSSVDDFLAFFDGHTGENYNPEECTYTVYAEDEEQDPVADVTFGFCTDTACRYVTTDEDGKAVFKGEPTKYHIQIIDAPEGFTDEMEEETYTEPYDQTLFIMVAKG